MTKVTYSISELAAEFGVTTRTIRFYEEKGLLAPARQGSTRVYNAADRTNLRLILRGKRLGFTLDESRDIIGMYDPAGGNISQLDKLVAGIRQKRLQLELQLQDLQAMMLDLEEAEQKCLEAKPSASRHSTQTA
jgi:DNA-binding transcriptional MerR regulator